MDNGQVLVAHLVWVTSYSTQLLMSKIRIMIVPSTDLRTFVNSSHITINQKDCVFGCVVSPLMYYDKSFPLYVRPLTSTLSAAFQCTLSRHFCWKSWLSSPRSKHFFQPNFPMLGPNADSFLIGVNNCCLVTMSVNNDHSKDLKLKQLEECTGIDTGSTIAGKGTFIMNIEDENGTINKIEMPSSLYAPNLCMVLLSPQY